MSEIETINFYKNLGLKTFTPSITPIVVKKINMNICLKRFLITIVDSFNLLTSRYPFKNNNDTYYIYVLSMLKLFIKANEPQDQKLSPRLQQKQSPSTPSLGTASSAAQQTSKQKPPGKKPSGKKPSGQKPPGKGKKGGGGDKSPFKTPTQIASELKDEIKKVNALFANTILNGKSLETLCDDYNEHYTTFCKSLHESLKNIKSGYKTDPIIVEFCEFTIDLIDQKQKQPFDIKQFLQEILSINDDDYTTVKKFCVFLPVKELFLPNSSKDRQTNKLNLKTKIISAGLPEYIASQMIDETTKFAQKLFTDWEMIKTIYDKTYYTYFTPCEKSYNFTFIPSSSSDRPPFPTDLTREDIKFQPIELSFSIRVEYDVTEKDADKYISTYTCQLNFKPSLDIAYTNIQTQRFDRTRPITFVTNVCMASLIHTVFNRHQCSTTIQPFTDFKMLFSTPPSSVSPLLQLKLCGYAAELTTGSSGYAGANQLTYLGICYENIDQYQSKSISHGLFNVLESKLKDGYMKTPLYEYLEDIKKDFMLSITLSNGLIKKVVFNDFFRHNEATQYAPFTHDVVKTADGSFSSNFGFYLMIPNNDSYIPEFSEIILKLTKLLYLARIACDGIKAESYQLRMEQLANATILKAYESGYKDLPAAGAGAAQANFLEICA